MPDNSNVSPVIEAGKRIGDPKSVPGNSGLYAVTGQGDKITDLEYLENEPRRIRQIVQAHDVATFNAYFMKFRDFHSMGSDDLEQSVIFADRDKFSITGILDYHHGLPSWCTHRVCYTAPRSPEWETWNGANQVTMKQADFAQFIENNVVDIRSPSGATILEVARNLQAKKSVDFSSAIRLASGEQQFTYSEAIQGSSSNGTISMPEEFTLGIPVFRGDAAYEVRARLRYRITDGKLSLWYDLYRPEVIEADAFGKVVEAVAAATATPVWQGRPA